MVNYWVAKITNLWHISQLLLKKQPDEIFIGFRFNFLGACLHFIARIRN